MPRARRPWQEELAIIDATMKAISGVTDPEELIGIYWDGIGQLVAIDDFVSVSRRNVEPPFYLITRSSRFTEQVNPWTERDKLPKVSGGLLGEILYGNEPVLIEDLPSRLSADDPAYFYLQGFQALVALPQYDNGESLNASMMLLPPGEEIDHAMVPTLHWQGGLFGRGTQNLVLRNQLSATLAELDRELKVVGDIQRSLLPSELPQIPGFDLAADYQTSARAGGDYYDFFPLNDGGWGLFIADISGHGTPAAVLMAITHAIAHAKPGTHTPPAALLEYLNERLCRAYTRDGTFVTAFYAVLDPQARTLKYATAGHNPPRLARGSGVLSLDEEGGLPLGLFPGQSYTEITTQLEPGDLLLLYTDGATEAMAPGAEAERQLFGVERLDRLLLECDTRSAADTIDRIRQDLADFRGQARPADDQTLIAMRCLRQ
ncbi:MAG: PP2C family protein-serine/threonine phosphatase [Pirellulales bacterium]